MRIPVRHRGRRLDDRRRRLGRRRRLQRRHRPGHGHRRLLLPGRGGRPEQHRGRRHAGHLGVRRRHEGDRHPRLGATYNSSGPNGKTDYRHVMAHTKVVDGKGYVYVGAERAKNDGTMVVDFELNRLKAKTWGDGIVQAQPLRQRPPDLPRVRERRLEPDRDRLPRQRRHGLRERPGGDLQGQWAPTTPARRTRSATNWVALAGVTFPGSSAYTIDAFNFAEASVNLSALDIPVDCLSFQQGSIRSRTGGAPDASQLKDASETVSAGPQHVRVAQGPQEGCRHRRPGRGRDLQDRAGPADRVPRGVAERHRRRRRTTPTARPTASSTSPACEPDTYKVTELTAAARLLPGRLTSTRPRRSATGGSRPSPSRIPSATIKLAEGGRRRQAAGRRRRSRSRPTRAPATAVLTVVDNGANDTDDTAGELAVRRVLIGGPYVDRRDPAARRLHRHQRHLHRDHRGQPGVARTWSRPRPARSSTPSARSAGVKDGPDGSALLGGATFIGHARPARRQGQPLGHRQRRQRCRPDGR